MKTLCSGPIHEMSIAKKFMSKDGAIRVSVFGRNYYFCSEKCKKEFNEREFGKK